MDYCRYYRIDQTPVKSTSKTDTTASCHNHDIEICGRVLDEKDEGLLGARIVLIDSNGKNTGAGASADIDGNFSIPLEEKNFTNGLCNIKISYLGYETQIIQGISKGQRYISIKMRIQEIGTWTGPREMNAVYGMISFHKRTPVQKIKYWFRRTFRSHHER
ncbi:MAG: SusC/RagA family TonB-linked outer membrane protein [Bacteroidetes bacterium]|nr:SusC/RagA family TonB-linked outer membrane protein [Bacteroidota bacterium]